MLLWKKCYETGNETVDGQHREIFRLGQVVLDADVAGGRKEKIESALKFLNEYALSHFAIEEALMIESGYPGLDEHKSQHLGFVDAVSDVMRRFESEGSTVHVSDTINGFVTDWLHEHIMGSDKAMAAFYRQWKK